MDENIFLYQRKFFIKLQKKADKLIVGLLPSILAACGSKIVEGPPLINEIPGTMYTDILRGTNYEDQIYGYAGNDQLFGFDGNDELIPGLGNDRVYGGNGADTIYIEDIAQILDGGEGKDTLVVMGRLQIQPLKIDLNSGVLQNISSSFFEGSTILKNIDNLNASNVKFVEVVASDVANIIETGPGTDTVSNIGMNDEIRTNAGNDYLFLSDLPKLIDGGSGIDQLLLMENSIDKIEISLDSNAPNSREIQNIEVFDLSEAEEVNFTGSDNSETIITGTGNDMINGKGGLDIITTGSGSDIILIERDQNSAVNITDFEVGIGGDKLQISNHFFSTKDNLELNFIDTKLVGKKTLNLESELAIFITAGGYNNIEELRLSLNSQNGIINSNSNSETLGFVGVWYNNQSDWTQVSLVSKSNETSNIFENVVNLAILQNVGQEELNLLSEFNFI